MQKVDIFPLIDQVEIYKAFLLLIFFIHRAIYQENDNKIKFFYLLNVKLEFQLALNQLSIHRNDLHKIKHRLLLKTCEYMHKKL